ncbi:MAG: TetR family transcriptional regulator [Salinisphaeraceae bacterium]|jgi:TetR/AcrR family transcriptional regulator|nr:TetR family transcriptional regulator [Salinisphaeraceae bacterium]
MESESKEHGGAEDILGAAKELFAEKGFDAVSVSAIAERAGSGKTNVFHHFGNKQRLYFAVMRGAVDRSELNMRAVTESDAEGCERLREAIRLHYNLLEEDPERARLIMREVMFSSPRQGQELAEEVFGDHFQAMIEMVRSLGLGSGQRAAFVAFMLMAANVMRFHCRNVMRHFPDSEFQDDLDGYVEYLSTMLFSVKTDSQETS